MTTEQRFPDPPELAFSRSAAPFDSGSEWFAFSPKDWSDFYQCVSMQNTYGLSVWVPRDKGWSEHMGMDTAYGATPPEDLIAFVSEHLACRDHRRSGPAQACGDCNNKRRLFVGRRRHA